MPLYGRGTGFIGAGKYLNANRGAGTRMAGGLVGGLERDEDAFRTGLGGLRSDFRSAQAHGAKDAPKTLGEMPGYADLARRAADVSIKARQAGTSGGVAQQLQGRYGRTSAGGSALDGFLAQAEGGQQLSGLGARFGDLGKALGVADTEEQAYQASLGSKGTGTAGGPGPKPGTTLGAPAPTAAPLQTYTPNYNRNGWRQGEGGQWYQPDQDKEFAYYRDAVMPDIFGVRIGGSGVMEMGEGDRAVYDDMSLEEREHLRLLPKNERKAWIDQRRAQIQGRARAAGF